MSALHRVCLLGFGEVGSILAADLLAHTDVRITVWDRLLSDPASAPAQKLAALGSSGRVTGASGAAGAARGAQVTVCAVTAGQSVAAADSVLASLEPGSWFVDFNSVSPSTKDVVRQAVTGRGARYLEVAVMSPIQPQRSGSPMLVCGADAGDFLPLAGALGFDGMRVLSEQAGQAAASKMCRSVMIKGMEALLAESLLSARHYGVEGEVLESLGNLFPGIDWREKSRYMISRSVEHGVRRSEEMEEAAKTVREAGLVPAMSDACVVRQRWAADFPAALQTDGLDGLLDAIRAGEGLEADKDMDGGSS